MKPEAPTPSPTPQADDDDIAVDTDTDTDTHTDTDTNTDTGSEMQKLGTCNGTSRPHLAYAWNAVASPEGTPNIIDSGNYGTWNLLDDALKPKEEAWTALANNWAKAGDGQRALIMRTWNHDTAPHNHPEDTPYYWDNGRAALTQQYEVIAAELQDRGMTPDYVFLDYEWDLSRSRWSALSGAERQAVVNDARYSTEIAPLLQETVNRYTAEAAPFMTNPENLLSDPWTLESYKWNRVQSRRINKYYRTAITAPLLAAFPDVRISNYDDWIPQDDAYAPDLNGHIQQIITFLDAEPLAGTRPSIQLYARMGQIESGWKNNPDPGIYPTAYPPTAENALRLAVRKSTSAYTPDMGLDIWVAPKEWSGHPKPTPLACPELVDDENAACTYHWEESILHSVLLTDAPLIWWGPPPSTVPSDARLQTVLDSLNALTRCDDREPLGALDTGWDASILVSGMRVEQLNIWRIGFADAAPPGTDGIRESEDILDITWGDHTLVVPDGVLWSDPDQPQGIWVVQPADSTRPYWK